MPFVADRELKNLLDPRAATIAGQAMTVKGAQRLAEVTRARTPIDTAERGGLPGSRPRGTARESIVQGPVRRHSSMRGRGWQARVYTEDPVFPYIEWNTRPHEIRPTAEHRARAEAEGRRAMLRFWAGGAVRFAASVHHPGTTGQHPFSTAAAFVQASVGEAMFRSELEDFAHNLVPSRTGRIIDRTKRPPVDRVLNAAVASWIRAHTVKINRRG